MNLPSSGPVVFTTTWPEGSSCTEEGKLELVDCGDDKTHLDFDDDA